MSTNPLLAKVKLPGRVFQLPSKGIFYQPGVLADHVVNGEVQIMPLSALAEMKLRSVDLLFSGRALREICLECAPDILQPENLISKDVDALFCFLRIVTYGAEMSIKSLHSCDHKTVHSYSVNLEQIIINPNNSILEHRDILYKCDLPNGQRVNLRPITFKDSIAVNHLRQELETRMIESGTHDVDLVQQMVVRDLLSAIESVETIDNGSTITVTDRLLIEEWAKKLQRVHFNLISEQAVKTNEWGFNLNVKLKCKGCGEEYSHNLELDPINFFSG